ncbi:Ubiquitin [Ceratobasidium sp. 414]|nr:Ubiquitin [Ceratobasidium sp. 414]
MAEVLSRCAQNDNASQDLNNLVISHPIDIEVQSGLKTYPLTLPGDSTIQYLKSLIQEKVPLQSSRLLPSIQGFSFLEDDKILQDYNIKAQSLVTIVTNIRVYVTTPRRSKLPIMATLYTNVSSLRLVISNRTDVSYPECILTCGGELLDDSKRLDSYTRIVPECEIVVRRREGIYFLKQFTLRVQPAWDQDEQEEYTVYPKTTVLDLKALLYNVNIISPDRQVLTFKGRELQNEHTIQDQGVQNGDALIMKLYNGRPKED